MHLAAGQLPDQPGLHGAKHQLPGLGLFPRAFHIVQDPLQLGGGEVGINNQSGLFPNHLGVAFGFQLVAVFAGAAALPHNSVIDRLTGVAVPHDGGLALVGDADSGNILGSGTDLVHGRERYAQLGSPNLVGIMLDPARLGEILGKFFLGHAANFAVVVKQDAAVRGRSGVKRHNVLFHKALPLAGICDD